MKERPIIFSGPMVRAILSGAKTQTRRVVNPQPSGPYGGMCWEGEGPHTANNLKWFMRRRCPYGQPGDRLWVRETWGHGAFHNGEEWIEGAIRYSADGALNPRRKWKPSIFMPRWASRITLEITNVRVERVQEISPNDALNEGVRVSQTDLPADSVMEFAFCWDSINAKRPGCSWSDNPWVWCLSFKRI